MALTNRLTPFSARVLKCFIRERNAERRVRAAEMRERVEVQRVAHAEQRLRLKALVDHHIFSGTIH